MINGRGRAPLIVDPDTGTRPQTKQDRVEQGAMLNHLPVESSCAALMRGGKISARKVTGYLVMTVKESSEEPLVSNQL